MKQKNTLQWLSIVAGKTKLLVGVLVAIQAVLSVSSIAFAFVLRRIINMAVDGARGGFWASLALLVGILLGQIMLSAASRYLSECNESQSQIPEPLISASKRPLCRRPSMDNSRL